MGKIRRSRQKYHLPAVRSNTLKINDGKEEISIKEPYSQKLEKCTKESADSSIFENLEIDLSQIKQLHDCDKRSIISNNGVGPQLSKKEKRKLRHDGFLQKIEAIKAAKKKEIETKKRKETPLVGDMKPLEEALPNLELLIKDNRKTRSQKLDKPQGKKTLKAQQKAMLQDIETFQYVLKHPAFQEDPIGTVTAHICKKLEQETMDS
ncbi:protein FAM207A-like [Limulus polyphemus]|uniref:Protein FAM207A-like n=1 Tax=Limulus polyphemus TaxID=6850 RepID=A0ABM1TK35_LIMPO|nr:protein FAM207A-like [Limulus polyphemus]XP_022256241.1 protein FAM207A-like [Limulus polyphemus]XP_022256242.1 protein FAM207A-like [Limulus polyphemus]